VSDIARNLELTRGSVSVTMQALRSSGWVEQDENHFYRLTNAGEEAARNVRAKHEILERVLIDILGLSVEHSHRESCRVEHVLEDETARRLVALLRFWQRHDLEPALSDEMRNGCDHAPDDRPCPCDGLTCLQSPAMERPAARFLGEGI
jgi:Mn-dependent DtxR family transcriptional regulator